MRHLLDIYVSANKMASEDDNFREKAKSVFKQMEAGDPDLLNRWSNIKDLSLKEFQKLYERLNLKFDFIESESDYKDQARLIAEEAISKGLTVVTKDGSVCVSIKASNGEEMTLPLLKRDGSTLYISRDLAAAIERKKKHNFDQMLYVVDNRQTDHFYNLKSVLNKMEYAWEEKLQHVNFGMIKGISTRTGNVVFLDELLDSAKVLALKSMEDSPNTKVHREEERNSVAEILGQAAVIINDLKYRRQKDYTFDLKRALHRTGDSGISLNYSHARLHSLDVKFNNLLNLQCEIDLLYQPEAINLILHLARFEDVLFEMQEELQPSILVLYLFRLCFLVNKAIFVLNLKGNERRVAEPRYLLFCVSRQVLHQGMKILGLEPLDQF